MYMRGDYYAGDYYAGDSIFSKIAKGVGGLLSHTPIGMAVSTGVSLVRSAAKKPQIQATGTNPAAQGQLGYERTTIGPGGILYSSTKVGASMGPSSPAMMATPGVGLMCTPGTGMVRRTHPNKSTYVTRGGGTSRWPQELIVHPKGTECVPSRRMNVANPRALRRALRRVAGFGKLAKRSRRAVSIAASSLGVRHRGAKRSNRR